MLKTPIFWLLFVMMTMMSTGGLMVVSNFAAFAREFGVADVVLLGIPTRGVPLARRLASCCPHITLVVASDPAVAESAGTRWLHLAAADPVPPAPFRWGRSCHDAGEMETAVMLSLGSVVITMANDPIFNFVMGAVLLVFALSLFGMFELQLPAGLARFTSAREGQGGYVGPLVGPDSMVVAIK